MKQIITLLTIISLFFTSSAYAQNIQKNTAFVKLKEEYRHYFNRSNRLQNHAFQQIGLKKVDPFFISTNPNQRRDANKKTHLDRIYKINFDYDVNKAIELLKQEGIFEVVEPSPIFTVLLQPNDPFADSTKTGNSGQTPLKTHNFYKAWEIEDGDTNVTIGIVDTGINFDHEDLQNNLKYNPFDPVDSLNNDMDMYFDSSLVDNYRGWDLSDWDNDPTGLNNHGTNVAGIAAADPNNEKGIAGIGYHSKFLPIKAAPNQNPASITHGYDGIKYAAEHDCKVINLSWGGVIPYFQVLQDLVNYATYDQNSVLVAAAGNSKKEEYFYPASFDNVISVGSLKADTTVLHSCTYNYAVDVIAVGHNMRTPSTGTSNYLSDEGTSLAAPVVSGAVALVRAKYPSLTAVQVAERIRVTGDIIDTLSKKVPVRYKDKIGRMLNPVRALTDSVTPSLRVVDFKTDKIDNYISNKGDTISLNLLITNYLYTAKNAKITVENISNNFVFIDSLASLKEMVTFDTTYHDNDPLKLYVPANTESEVMLTLRIGYVADNGYLDHQYINVTVKPTVISNTIEQKENAIASFKNIVYPNPFEDKIFLTLDQQLINQSVNFDIYNSLNQLIYSETKVITEETHEIELPKTLEKGVYFLKIRENDSVDFHKLIKN
ncbi:MAG: S8 family serine peptidase [Cytophagales bacterium]|nr:S8 family serine peptidase [Cytophagales bacterium]